ncbi:hypothetical protein [Aeoliella mucimassa]|uniref:Uncharacterized protein n=1 Tax=Aeoliella mucimassa TaxID=2527972 RepID=A0A518AJ03_9BACT|nr:hypothetical protein [Aeoliella mucimassa]QDU54718.1 hypothetical protein Pan181_09010 [Aeoliella mucimassa]
MAIIQSPFDEPSEDPPEAMDSDAESKTLPARKWSLVILAVALFVLVWFREIVAMPASATMAVTVFIFFCWLVVHFTFFVDHAELTASLPHEAARSGQELIEHRDPRVESVQVENLWPRWRVAVVGILVGVWLPRVAGVSPWEVTAIVFLFGVIMYFASRVFTPSRKSPECQLPESQPPENQRPDNLPNQKI